MAKRGRPRKNPLPDEEVLSAENRVEHPEHLKVEYSQPKATTKKIDGVMSSMLTAAQKEFGKKGIYVGTSDSIKYKGIDLRHLALKWMLDSNILPFGKIMHVAGQRMSAKSAFAYFMGDLFMRSGGGQILIDTEGKISPSLLSQMTTVKKHLDSRYMYRPTSEVEEWMKAINFFVEQVTDANKRATKNLMPVLCTIDSLTGAATKDQHKEIDKDGAPKAGYDRSTILISRQMKSLSDNLVGLPMCVMLTNHLKHDLGDPFGHRMRSPGGDAPGFHSSYDIWFTNRRQLMKGPVPEGFIIKMVVQKNSLGACWRMLRVPFHWTIEHDGPETERKAWFDWDFALSDLIVRLHEHEGFTEDVCVAEIKNVTDKEPLKSQIRCPDFGIEDFISYPEFGATIQKNEDFMSRFIKFFDIPQHEVANYED